MIDIHTIITKLTTDTGYKVEIAKSNEQDIYETTDLPLLSVGYGAIRNSAPQPLASLDVYSINGEDISQSFYIKYICSPEVFSVVFIDVFKTLTGWNPIIPEALHTCFSYTNGEPIGFNNNAFLFVSEWKINFPTNTLLV
jgi:hypothetical protein